MGCSWALVFPLAWGWVLWRFLAVEPLAPTTP
jgi:hypothetical protein